MQTQEPFYSARRLFPRGLEQPQGSLRFGADALLLAAFAARGVEGMNEARRKQLTAAELGCGCGAALLALALRCETVTGLGLEREAPLVQAATANALRLGLADRLHFAQADLADRALLADLPDLPCMPGVPGVNGCKAGSLDLVLANPPYGVEGRPSQSHMRERALRGAQGAHVAENRTQVLTVFCRAAAGLLRHQGYFFCIYDALALPHLSSALDAAGFGLRGLLPVRTYASRPALRVLVLARKNAAHQCAIEAPLTLHVGKPRGGKQDTAQTESGQTDTAQATTVSPRWSAQALRFCPWLG